jgi:hypothetical protein
LGGKNKETKIMKKAPTWLSFLRDRGVGGRVLGGVLSSVT